MTTGPTPPERPQLRPIEVSRISHEGSDFFLLKDPRRLSEESLLVPASLGPYLQNIDGTNTVQEIIEAASDPGVQPVPLELVDADHPLETGFVLLDFFLEELLLPSHGDHVRPDDVLVEET